MSQSDEPQSDRPEDLESRLRDALRPQAPREAFTEALLANLAAPRPRGPRSAAAGERAGDAPRARRARRMSGWWLSAGLAAAVLVAVGAFQYQRAAHEREAGLEARREVIEALRVTTQKLDLAYRTVRTQSNARPDGDPGV